MNAAEVIAGLEHRWPASEYLSIREAPQDSMRQGRKLDLLVISQWESRGHEREGVEVKVSYSDWRRELKEAAKADWWFQHVHRFWIAVPDAIADKVRPEMPTGWGLLAVREDGSASVIKVKPQTHEPRAFTWNTCIGLLRAGADAGPRALESARSAGERLGRVKAEAEFERQSGDGRAQAQLEALQQAVREFEAASGVELAKYVSRVSAAKVGEAFRLAVNWGGNPREARQSVSSAIGQLERAIKALQETDTVFGKLEADGGEGEVA